MIKKFLLKAFVLVFNLLALMLAAIFLPVNQGKQNMLYTQVEKNILLKNTVNPRIIFLGGSNLAFGLDSKRIKDSLQINPVNTAIHINIGLKYMLKNTLQFIKEGDIIIVSPEYQQFYGNLADGEMELFSLVTDIVPQSKSLLDYRQYLKLIQLVPEFAQSKLRPILLFYKYPKPDGVIGRYDREAFNTYGDAIAHWKLSAENPKPYSKITESFNNDILNTLISFRDSLYRKKAKLYITFPGYQYSSYKINIIQIKQVEQQLKDSHFLLISSPQEYIIPDSLIFDTPYHLTKKGVDLRTGLLIKDLKKVIKR